MKGKSCVYGNNSSNKLSAGRGGCLPRCDSLRLVCNEPCYWSRGFDRIQKKAAGVMSLY